MKVLQSTEQDRHLVLNCKKEYLQGQNQWLQGEINFLSSIILHLKQILHQPSQHHPLLSAINSLCQSHVLAHSSRMNAPLLPTPIPMAVPVFLTLVGSFENKLLQLRSGIEAREKDLQLIQATKHQTVEEIKVLAHYDLYSNMLERAKKQLLTLEAQLRKKLTSETSLDSSKGAEEECIGGFEMGIIVYKKKKINNEKLREQLMQIKRKNKEYEKINQNLGKSVEYMEWCNLEQCQYNNGPNTVMECPYGDQLSIMGKTLLQNYDLSIDISRFINQPKKNKKQ